MRLGFLISLLIFTCCSHPESSEFSRNKDQNKQFSNADSQDAEVLNFEVENGVKYVWIEVNGIRLRFIFDTGASNICISEAEAITLYKQGTLTEDDILETQSFQDATGTISNGTKIILREVKIGNQKLENIEALVVSNFQAPLLLGQSALERFDNIRIDNKNRQITFNLNKD
jgi:aspartyl protease family protein